MRRSLRTVSVGHRYAVNVEYCWTTPDCEGTVDQHCRPTSLGNEQLPHSLKQIAQPKQTRLLESHTNHLLQNVGVRIINV